MDRTSEFLSVAEVLRAHAATAGAAIGAIGASAGATAGIGAGAGATARASGAVAAVKIPPPSALARASADTAKALRRATERVQRLYRLAARRGLFDDPAAEIADLTGVCKADIASLDTRLRAFVAQAAAAPAASAASAAAAAAGGGSGGGPREHWMTAADALNTRLLAATRLFQDALRLRSQNMADQAARRRQFAASSWAPGAALHTHSPLFAPPPLAAAPNGTGAGGHHGHTAGAAPSSAAPNAHGATGALPSAAAEAASGSAQPSQLRRRAGAGGVGPPGQAGLPTGGAPGAPTGAGHSAFAPPRLPGAAAAMPGAHGASSYSYTAAQLSQYHDARARAAEMQTVESTIVELGHMFTRMATLVAEQGETVSRIDADMDTT